MEGDFMNVFETLNNANVNGHTEEKNGLTYLSWAWAWAEVKKAFPEANYTIEKFNGLPYVYDENTGYMVYTTVTIEGITHEMWLPVMDGANKAMKAKPYTYTVKRYGKEEAKTVAAATMFDVNKAIMRCLVKNLAMFGLGLYIYAGEDLPEVEQNANQMAYPSRDEMLREVSKSYPEGSKNLAALLGTFGVDSLDKATDEMLMAAYNKVHK
jgi:hypothetical protein